MYCTIPSGTKYHVGRPDAVRSRHAVEEALFKDGSKVLRREGESEKRWVLLDFGDIVVHIQHEDERQFYDLERLWRDCPQVDVGVVGADQAAATAARSAVQD